MKNKLFYHILSSERRIIEFLRKSGVVATHANCDLCGKPMKTDWTRGEFRCRQTRYVENRNRKRVRKQCDTTVSVYNGSWFSGKKVKIQKLFELIFLYCQNQNCTQEYLGYQTGMSDNTISYWCRRIRETISMEYGSNSPMLGGEFLHVEVDEAKLGGRKLPGGREVKGQWVAACIERDSGRFFIIPVPNRSADTLIPFIKKYVKPDTVIVSDCWTGYKGLLREGYPHLRVNHKFCHVNPKNGAHTQKVERLWRSLRDYLPDNGVKKTTLEGELSRFKFLKLNSRQHRFETFLKIIQFNNNSA